MKRNAIQCFLLGVFSLALWGCEPRHIDPSNFESVEKAEPLDPAEIRFSDINDLILVPHCLKCHGSERPADGINLTSVESMNASFSWPPVLTAGDPQMSSLYLSVAAGRMPKRAPPLEAELIDLLKKWIEFGAQE